MKGFRVTVDEVKELLQRGENVFFIDARTSEDWEKTKTKVKGAVRLTGSKVEEHLDDIPRNRTVVTY